MGIINLERIIRHAPDLVKLVEAAGNAVTGDEAAREYIKKQGIYDLGDALIHDGVGSAAKGGVAGINMLINRDSWEHGDPSNPPWQGFLKRLFAQKFGGHILLGSPGTGKTETAKKLAYRFSRELGYEVEWYNFYLDDVPDFGKLCDTDNLVARMGSLKAYLKSVGARDDEEEDDLDPESIREDVRWHFDLEKARKGKKYPPKLPPFHKVIVIDEVGLAMSTDAHDPLRRAALNYVAQCRHAKSIVLFLAQQASMIPLGLFKECCTWTKKPVGEESDTDRDNPFVQMLWQRATDEFRGLRRNPYYQIEPHWQAWSYVYCLSLNGQPGYKGLIPTKMYKEAA